MDGSDARDLPQLSHYHANPLPDTNPDAYADTATHTDFLVVAVADAHPYTHKYSIPDANNRVSLSIHPASPRYSDRLAPLPRHFEEQSKENPKSEQKQHLC